MKKKKKTFYPFLAQNRLFPWFINQKRESDFKYEKKFFFFKLREGIIDRKWKWRIASIDRIVDHVLEQKLTENVSRHAIIDSVFICRKEYLDFIISTFFQNRFILLLCFLIEINIQSLYQMCFICLIYSGGTFYFIIWNKKIQCCWRKLLYYSEHEHIH